MMEYFLDNSNTQLHIPVLLPFMMLLNKCRFNGPATKKLFEKWWPIVQAECGPYTTMKFQIVRLESKLAYSVNEKDSQTLFKDEIPQLEA